MAKCTQCPWITTVVVQLALAVPSARGQCAWWDGYSDSPGGLAGQVGTLVVWDDDGGGPNAPRLIAGGAFETTSDGLVVLNQVARFDGNGWSSLGAGIGGAGAVVHSLLPIKLGAGRVLIAGGAFNTFIGSPADNIASFSAGAWSPLTGGGADGAVRALALFKGELFVGGIFNSVGGPFGGPGYVDAKAIARWDGATWNPVGSGFVELEGGFRIYEVYALAVFNESLYVAGDISRPGGSGAVGIARWDGMQWHHVGGGLGRSPFYAVAYALAVHDDDGPGPASPALYVGGNFTTAGGVPATLVARWDGASWSALGTGLWSSFSGGLPTVEALVSYDDGTGPGLYAGGAFDRAGPLVVNGIARWRGNAWSRLEDGLTLLVGGPGSASTLAVFDADGVGRDPSNLYVGGVFEKAGPVASGNIARWFDRDSDGDGLLDCWETQGKGIDYNYDGTYDLDLYARGARANHKDVFVEVDAMIDMAPDAQAITDVVNAFAAAPNNLVNNPDGLKGINLHVDLDSMETTIPGASWVGLDANGWPLLFDKNKDAFFGTPAERSDPNQLAAKRCAYRYCIFASSYGATASSGLAELGGNDFMVTLGLWSVSGGTQDEQAGTFMHELGHTLGLRHGGGQWDNTSDDRYNYKPNYHSVMNYTWQVPALVLANPPATPEEQTYVDSWRLDYSHAAMGSLDEANLSEPFGISGGDPLFVVPAGPPPFRLVPEADYVDWNRNNSTSDTGVVRDINRLWAGLAAWPNDRLHGHADWPNLDYNFRDNSQYADGVHDDLPPSEMTQEIVNLLAARPGGCRLDFDGDLDIDGDDLAIFIACATGPAIPYDPEALPPGCTLAPDGELKIRADDDRDGDVDQDDFGLFQQCMTGTNPPAAPGRAD